VVTLIPLFFIPLFVEIPAGLFLIVWFLTQIFSGFSLAQSSNVAWWAHAGGFVAGILLLRLFENSGRCLECTRAGKKTQPFWTDSSRFRRH
jgi:membrane associated rhomboid family serine protease